MHCANKNPPALSLHLPRSPLAATLIEAAQSIEGIRIVFYEKITEDFRTADLSQSIFLLPITDTIELYSKGERIKIYCTLSAGYSAIVSSASAKDLDEIRFAFSINEEKLAKLLERHTPLPALLRGKTIASNKKLLEEYQNGTAKTVLLSVPELSRISNLTDQSYIIFESKNTLVPEGFSLFPAALLVTSDQFNSSPSLQKILTLLPQATENCITVPDKTALLLTKAGIKMPPEILTAAINDSNFIFIRSADCAQELTACARRLGVKDPSKFAVKTIQ